MQSLEEKTFLLLVVVASVAFGWILWPFSGAILWAMVMAIVFAPLYRRLAGPLGQRRNFAAITTIVVIVFIVLLPVAVISTAMVQEAAGVYDMIKAGQLDFGNYFNQVSDALPLWARNIPSRFGLDNLAAIQQKLVSGLQQGSQFLATQILTIGQSAFEFFINLGVMLYLLFFLLRDGDMLFDRIKGTIPLNAGQQVALFSKFAAVVRATVKGDILVSILQGALGGLIFWILGIHAPLLWAVLMAFLSLLPAVGAALIWLPVAIYLIATGTVWKGVVLIGFGAFIIGLVDNLLRPYLVGKDTNMPNYVVLISTLGGLDVFGLNGFVIGPTIAATFIAVWGIFAASRATARERIDGP